MTLEEALGLAKGDVVVTKYTLPSYEPVPVTAVWINDRRDIVLLRLHKIIKDAWLDALGYELPPAGKIWCHLHHRWEWSADHRRDHPEYYQGNLKRDRRRGNRGAR